MKDRHCKKAFTLIELLVVVLIIGILTAVALPKYQKAVQRSKNAQLKAVLRSIEQAEAAYYLANGKYAANFDELSLDLPLDKPQVSGNFTNYVNTQCGPAVKGPDSVRRGKDFDVYLGMTNFSNMAIGAVWTKGKYKCTGFKKNVQNSKLQCTEFYNGHSQSIGTDIRNKGHFCEKIEKGTNGAGDQWNDWRWDLL